MQLSRKIHRNSIALIVIFSSLIDLCLENAGSAAVPQEAINAKIAQPYSTISHKNSPICHARFAAMLLLPNKQLISISNWVNKAVN